MADDFNPKSTQAFKAGNTWLEGKIGSELRNIDNPLLRGAAGDLLKTVFPSFGGADYTNNSYENMLRKAILKKQAEAGNEAALSILQAAEGNGATPGDTLAQKYDWRARLRPKAGGADKFYAKLGDDDYLMKPIKDSNGLVWQYTPQIFLSGTAEYNQQLMQGMNYPINTFINGRAPDIPVTADFTANDAYEARYLLAVMTFLRVCTKAYFGDPAVASGDYGTPPPVMVFEYLGDHGFNKVPVVVSNYQMQLPDDVDYVPVEHRGTVTYVPAKTSITVNLMPTYTPHKLRRRFDLESVANGKAYKDGFI